MSRSGLTCELNSTVVLNNVVFPLDIAGGFANRTDAFSSREDCMKCAVPWNDDADCPKPPPPPTPVS